MPQREACHGKEGFAAARVGGAWLYATTTSRARQPRAQIYTLVCALLLCAAPSRAAAAEHGASIRDAIVRGTIIRRAVLRIQPDAGAAKLATVERGRDVVVLKRTPGWIQTVVTLGEVRYSPVPGASHQRDLTGWMLDKGFISARTPHGDAILFGEAADSEERASRRDGRKGAAGDARRLYYRVYQLFPNSPLAGEALYRSADIQWQLDRADLRSRASYLADPSHRPEIDESAMRLVEKKFPHTRWADLAAYEMLENKLCADWMDASKCPAREAKIYEKFADKHPASPKAVEAYCKAAYRWAALMTIYKGEGKAKRIPSAQRRAEEDARKALGKNASPEWNARAQRLLYVAQHAIAVWGSAEE